MIPDSTLRALNVLVCPTVVVQSSDPVMVGLLAEDIVKCSSSLTTACSPV